VQLLAARWRRWSENLLKAAEANELRGAPMAPTDEWHRGQAAMAEACARELEEALEVKP
jgi:hypothetical protein